MLDRKIFHIYFLYIWKSVVYDEKNTFSDNSSYQKAFTLFDHLLFLIVELLLVCTDAGNFKVVDKQEHKYVVVSYGRHAEPSEGRAAKLCHKMQQIGIKMR